MKKTFQIVVISALVLLAGFGSLTALRWVLWKPARAMEDTARAMIGRPEAELLAALGGPQHIVLASDLDGRAVNYPWAGMNYLPVPDRPVSNKVLLYSKLDTAIYVYIGADGRVEFVATAYT